MFGKSLSISIMIKPLIFILGVLSLLMPNEPVTRQDVFLFCLKPDMQPLNIVRSNLDVSVYAQKISWQRVESISDLPISHREGSIFISNNNKWA